MPNLDCVKIGASDASPYLHCKIQRAYCFPSANSQSSGDISALTSLLPSLTPSNGAGVHISEIDVNYDLDLLHIGDRVLEMNGVTIKGKSVKEIESLIEKFRDQVIRLTVEQSSPSSQGRQSSTSSTASSLPTLANVAATTTGSTLSSEAPFSIGNGSNLKHSGQHSQYCDANIFNVETTKSKSKNSSIAAADDDDGAVPLSGSISSLKKLTNTRANSGPSPVFSIAGNSETPNGGKYPTVNSSKSIGKLSF